MKKIVTVLTALLAVTAFGGMTVTAADMIPEDTIIEELWDSIWHGHGDNGTTFPETSYEYYLLSDWVSSNYGSDDCDWTNLNRISFAYSRYYSKLTREWDYTDDEEGNWFITDENSETYHFELIQGEWNKIDSSGNTVEKFPPHSTLEENEANQTDSIFDEDEAEDGIEDRGEAAQTLPEDADGTQEKTSEWENQMVDRLEASQSAAEPIMAEAAASAIAATAVVIPAQGNTGQLPYIAVAIGSAAAGAVGTYLLTSKRKTESERKLSSLLKCEFFIKISDIDLTLWIVYATLLLKQIIVVDWGDWIPISKNNLSAFCLFMKSFSPLSIAFCKKPGCCFSIPRGCEFFVNLLAET